MVVEGNLTTRYQLQIILRQMGTEGGYLYEILRLVGKVVDTKTVETVWSVLVSHIGYF